MRLEFKHVPSAGQIISFYNPSDYPTLELIPLSSGQRARFGLLSKFVLEKIEKKERKFVPENERSKYIEGAIDKDGINTFSLYFIQVTLTTLKGEVFFDTLKTPDQSRVLLKGDTEIGDYELNLWDIKEPVSVELIHEAKRKKAK
jgi:hypothetical protein